MMNAPKVKKSAGGCYSHHPKKDAALGSAVGNSSAISFHKNGVPKFIPPGVNIKHLNSVLHSVRVHMQCLEKQKTKIENQPKTSKFKKKKSKVIEDNKSDDVETPIESESVVSINSSSSVGAGSAASLQYKQTQYCLDCDSEFHDYMKRARCYSCYKHRYKNESPRTGSRTDDETDSTIDRCNFVSKLLKGNCFEARVDGSPFNRYRVTEDGAFGIGPNLEPIRLHKSLRTKVLRLNFDELIGKSAHRVKYCSQYRSLDGGYYPEYDSDFKLGKWKEKQCPECYACNCHNGHYLNCSFHKGMSFTDMGKYVSVHD